MKAELATPIPRLDWSALIPPGLQVQVFTELGEAALAGYIVECEAAQKGAEVGEDETAKDATAEQACASTSARG